MSIEKIGVIGTGGVGGYFGGKLCFNPAVKVYFIARGAHLKAIQDQGLTLVTEQGTLTCRPTLATNRLSDLPVLDLALICVKSYDLEAAIRNATGVVSEKTAIIPLLNGVDIPERIRKIVSPSPHPSCLRLYRDPHRATGKSRPEGRELHDHIRPGSNATGFFRPRTSFISLTPVAFATSGWTIHGPPSGPSFSSSPLSVSSRPALIKQSAKSGNQNNCAILPYRSCGKSTLWPWKRALSCHRRSLMTHYKSLPVFPMKRAPLSSVIFPTRTSRTNGISCVMPSCASAGNAGYPHRLQPTS